MLIVTSSDLARIAPPAVSKVHADHVEKWEKSGDLVTIVNNLTQDETLTLLAFTSKRFGKYVLKSGTRPNGKTWALKELRVGSKILPVRGYEVRAVFDVILYRRDLAGHQGIRRPWRKISRRNDNLQTIKISNLIELPKWMMR